MQIAPHAARSRTPHWRREQSRGVSVGITLPQGTSSTARLSATAVSTAPSRSSGITRWFTRTPSSAVVSVRPTWRMNRWSGEGVEPTICAWREAKSITDTVSHVAKPHQVQTSVVNKSAPAIAPQCARRNVCHDVGRSGTSLSWETPLAALSRPQEEAFAPCSAPLR